MFYSIRKDRSVCPPTPSPSSTFILYGSAKCWELVKCCQSLIFFSLCDSRVMVVVIEGVRVFVFFSLAARIQARNPHTFTRQPIASLLLLPFFPTPPLSLPHLSPPLLTNGINRPWNNQCWWSILEPVDMLMSKPHRYCCRVINHCLLPECIAAGAANPGPGIKHCLLTINVQTFCCPVPWLFSDAKKVGRIVNQ